MKSKENSTRNTKNVLVAIDCGSYTIKAIAAEEQADSSLKILAEERASACDYVRYGIVKTTSLEFTITNMLRLLANRIKEPQIKSVFVSVGGRSMQLVEMTAKRVLGANRLISEAVLNDMQQECKEKFQRQNETLLVYDIFPQYFWLDDSEEKEYIDPQNMKAHSLQGFYLALVGLADIREKTKRCFERTPIEIEDAEGMLKLDAQKTALLTDEEQHNGAAILDFGAETTTLSIYQNAQLQQVCVVPLGGAHITKDIQAIGISADNAEKLKRARGNALEECVTQPVAINIPSVNPNEPKVRISTRFLAQIIEARLTEMTAKIFSLLNNFEFETDCPLYLTGGGAKLENMVEFVQAHTQLQVHIGSHAEWLTDDTNEQFIDPEYSQLIGTLALGAKYREETANQPMDTKGTPKKRFKKWLGEKIEDLFTDEETM